MHRHANIFNLIFEIGFTKDVMATLEDNDGKNILHLAAKLPHPNRVNIVSGAALQMQRELLWFKEVEKLVQPSFREKKNKNGQTPQELFTQEHKELLSNGESWMKNTASSCILVATIIVTVIFAMVFSVPSGNDNNRGIPTSLRDTLFQVFVISDAIALSSSSFLILVFLSILSSQNTKDDFLISLPFKLILGFSSLFISIITMMIAFIATIFLAYQDRLNWVTIHMVLLASMPTTIFVLLCCPLLREISYSTYRSRFLFKSSTTIL
ncbi:hypothetical protein Pint_12089 [Pistacia integerrima]|uniref:Uncharacterized protein n=1 Tax=Pistacia integerrima TaxID=434235 RepID=A0ACC0XIM5_9ROSI|nr:hypothetical protein Pint_12089 [Pistacia integerrima]